MADSTLQVAIIMESQSDWDTMRLASEMLTRLHILHECRILSTSRSLEALVEYVQTSEVGGVRVFIAGAGGAAPLAGVVAANTSWPVLGVPMPSKALCGLDSLLAVVQMPKGCGDISDWRRGRSECRIIGCRNFSFNRCLSLSALASVSNGSNEGCAGSPFTRAGRKKSGGFCDNQWRLKVMGWEIQIRKLRRQNSNRSGGIPAKWENGRMKHALLAVLKRKHVVAGDYASSASSILSKDQHSINHHLFSKHFYRPRPKFTNAIKGPIDHKTLLCFGMFGDANDFIIFAFIVMISAGCNHKLSPSAPHPWYFC